MSRLRSTLLASLTAFTVPMASATLGCSSGPTIPGTDIPDTDANRAILQVVERYRIAFLARDAATVLAVTHPTYFDHAGTDDPTDDVGYDDLAGLLRTRFSQLDSIRFTIDYLDVHVHNDRATVKVWLDASFRFKPIMAPDGRARPQAPYARKQDHAEFTLLREGDSWLMTSGI